jgi:phage-related protein
MIRGRGVLKTKRLLTINCFLKRTMEESIFDIELVNRPLRRDGYTENCANGAGLNNRRESFIVVNAMLLRKTATNPPSFIARKTTVRVEFLTKNPLTRNDVCTGRSRNKLPGVILKKGRKLISHGSSPIGV